jgi:hypothetical protein
MYLNDIASVLIVFGAYFAVLAFGLSCSWLASHRRQRRDRQSVGASDAGGCKAQ